MKTNKILNTNIMKCGLPLILLLLGCLKMLAQTNVVELGYNLNGEQYNALCVLDGLSGKCHVVCNMGHCWYDAQFSSQSTYKAISVSNPSIRSWYPGVFVFTNYGNYLDVQGYKYPLTVYFVPQEHWKEKLTQYGFQTNSSQQYDESISLYDEPEDNIEVNLDSETSDNDYTLLVIGVVIVVGLLFYNSNKNKGNKTKGIKP